MAITPSIRHTRIINSQYTSSAEYASHTHTSILHGVITIITINIINNTSVIIIMALHHANAVS
jgi:hypothetical protein